MQKIFELGLKDLAKMCEALDLKNKQGIYLLSGDLASGKTSFVKKAAKYLGYKNAVTSPTFLVMQKYGERIFHYDIYQKNLEELLQLGFLEEIEQEGWHFVEWGDEKLATILKQIGIPFVSIKIYPKEKMREYHIDA